MSVTPEEKMKLMLELGMEDAAAKWAEANNLTTMKFRPISFEKIEELLSVEYKTMTDPEPGHLALAIGLGVGFGHLGSWETVQVAGHAVTHFSWLLYIGINALTAMIGYWLYRPRKTTRIAEVCQMPLHEWDANLPYGALLSVKEAKAQGFKNFTIFFPATQESEYTESKRIKDDPIIVANKKGYSNKMYNIFAWDDGKVYE